MRYQVQVCAGNLREGDVLMTNHPVAGGTHLPDITVITPVFAGGVPVFFVASRGHHADIGGITPGSMPPHSKALVEEGKSWGACITGWGWGYANRTDAFAARADCMECAVPWKDNADCPKPPPPPPPTAL